jgi:uncharacterized tellurite resistance protein B-like protein
MSPLENLHYAIGELAYCIARADGEVQKEERKKFEQILREELVEGEGQEKVGEIIFKLMDKRDYFDAESTYDLAMQTIKINGHYLSPTLKAAFIRLLQRVAEAHPPVTSEENAILIKFKTDIAPINGDPVYYSVH